MVTQNSRRLTVIVVMIALILIIHRSHLINILTIWASFISPIEIILNSTSTITGGPVGQMTAIVCHGKK